LSTFISKWYTGSKQQTHNTDYIIEKKKLKELFIGEFSSSFLKKIWKKTHSQRFFKKKKAPDPLEGSGAWFCQPLGRGAHAQKWQSQKKKKKTPVSMRKQGSFSREFWLQTRWEKTQPEGHQAVLGQRPHAINSRCHFLSPPSPKLQESCVGPTL
jgi:hypothetical protein